MAKINGVEIKTYKTSVDHEGFKIVSAVVYIDGKKAGHWLQDSWGGPDSYDEGMYEVISERAKEFQKGFPKNYMYYIVMDDADCFMESLIRLCDHEKQYKQAVKHGYPSMIINTENRYTFNYLGLRVPVTKEMTGTVLNKYKNGTIINSLEDFDITIDENHPCPNWMLAE